MTSHGEVLTPAELDAIRRGFEDALDSFDIGELASIVRDLAAVECPVSTIVSYVTGDIDGLCPTCDAVLESDAVHTITDHEPSCPWLRAQAWIAAHDRP